MEITYTDIFESTFPVHILDTINRGSPLEMEIIVRTSTFVLFR